MSIHVSVVILVGTYMAIAGFFTLCWLIFDVLGGGLRAARGPGLRRHYLYSRQSDGFLGELAIPAGQYGVVLTDHDAGACMSGAPDPEPRVYPGFGAVARAMKIMDDTDMEFAVFDGNRELVCVGFVGTGFRLFPLEAYRGAEPGNAAEIDALMVRARLGRA